MRKTIKRHVDKDFFKHWTPEMSYILGYVVADGCVIKRKGRINSYTFNITSKDKKHLLKISKILKSNYPVSIKFNSEKRMCHQMQISNFEICKDLINLGILPRKTYNLKPIKIPEKYFSAFVRGFFDGDGTVYIYRVNGAWQLKSGFVSHTSPFLENFSKHLCKRLNIISKTIHKQLNKNTNSNLHSVCLYINDSEKLSDFMYKNAKIYLERKKRIFDKWKLIKRRHYIKRNYPSKVGWYLNKKIFT